MQAEERLEQINKLIPALSNHDLIDHLKTECESLTSRLIGENDEQIRGRIKQLLALIDLPASLQSERDLLQAALSEQDAAD